MARKFDVSKSLEIVYVDGMPMMKIPCIDMWKDKEVEHNYYLSPFRGYCFQISGNAEGVGDYASTPVVGLGNIIRACRGYEAPGSSLSIYASNFSSLERGIFDSLVNACIDRFECNCENSFMEFPNTMKILPEFIQASIGYISSLVR